LVGPVLFLRGAGSMVVLFFHGSIIYESTENLLALSLACLHRFPRDFCLLLWGLPLATGAIATQECRGSFFVVIIIIIVIIIFTASCIRLVVLVAIIATVARTVTTWLGHRVLLIVLAVYKLIFLFRKTIGSNPHLLCSLFGRYCCC